MPSEPTTAELRLLARVLSPWELRILLWHLDVVDRSYANIAPEGTCESALRGKLEAALALDD